MEIYTTLFADSIYLQYIDSNTYRVFNIEDLVSYRSPVLIQFYKDYQYIISHNTLVPYRKSIYNA